jgi:hypothetical protein
LILQYVRDVVQLQRAVGRPFILLQMTRNRQYINRCTGTPASYFDWAGDHLYFIDDVVVDSLRSSQIHLAVSRPSKGLLFIVKNPNNIEPAPVFAWQEDPSLNNYYPSREMHDQAAGTLLDKIRELNLV